MSELPLLSTKYAQPLLPRRTVDRAELFDRFNEPAALVVVSAPAGYGKTTLVAGWLATRGHAAAWLTLEHPDNDPAVFVAYLAAAVARARPEIGSLPGDLRSRTPTTASLVPLLNAIDSLGESVVIVLDDYHQIVEPAIHELVSFLVHHAPIHLRVVVATRADPPLPLARLRARGRLVEVRSGDLRFAPRDAHRFLTEAMGLAIPEPIANRLTERTEGWIAGLQLAALSLRGRADMEAFVEAFGASDRYIFDYLTDEALARQPAEVRSFLETTCVLDRLTGPLCDALTGRGDGSSMLAMLADANVFLLPLDDRRTWYRYHRLFADLLASGLDAERTADLHRLAAGWLEANGDEAAAIRHRLAAGDTDHAARLMESTVDLVLARGEFRTVMAWCDALPPDALATRPGLAIMRAWALFLQGDIGGAEASLAAVGGGLHGDARTAARQDCLRAWFANRHDAPEAEALARTALAGIPPSDPVFRSLACTTLGEALLARDPIAASDAFAEAHQLAGVSRRSALSVGTVYSLVNTDLVLGRRRAAEDLCRRSIAELGDPGGMSPSWLGMLHLPLGVALFEAGRTEAAVQHIAIGNELCTRAGLTVTMLGSAEWHEILALHQLGRAGDAWRRLEAVRREGERQGIPRIVVAMRLLAAELNLLEGDPDGALAQVEQDPGPARHALGNVLGRRTLTHARVLLALGRPVEALAQLEPFARDDRTAGRRGRLLGTLAATAAANASNGEHGAARRALREAVAIAAPEDYRRPFIDPIVRLERLLADVRDVAPDFVDELLGHFAEGRPRAVAPRGQAGIAADEDDDRGPVETLSVRELEVLRLVAAGLSNDEIGRELFVTGGTAKWHVHNVLAKMGCRNRVGLVARARSLGLV